MWSRKDICFVVCRVLAITLVTGLSTYISPIIEALKGYFENSGSGYDPFNIITFSLNALIPIIFAVILWVFADRISGWIIGGSGGDKNKQRDTQEIIKIPESRDLQYLAFSIVGLLCILFAVYHVSGIFIEHSVFWMNPLPKLNPILKGRHKATLIGSLLIGFIGLGLMLGSKGIAGFLFKLRNSHTSET